MTSMYKHFDTFIIGRLFKKFTIEMFFVKQTKTKLTVQTLQKIVSELRITPAELSRSAQDPRFGDSDIELSQTTAKNFEEFLSEKCSKTTDFPLISCPEEGLTQFKVNPDHVKNIKTLRDVRTCFAGKIEADPMWLEVVAPSSKYPDTPLADERQKSSGGEGK